MKKSYETPRMDILSLDMGSCVLNASLNGAPSSGSYSPDMWIDEEGDDLWD